MTETPDISMLISLGDCVVSARIDKMLNDNSSQTNRWLEKNWILFTFRRDEPWLRLVRNQAIIEEFLFTERLKSDTNVSTIFKTVKNLFNERSIPLVIAYASDGVPLLIDCHRGILFH